MDAYQRIYAKLTNDLPVPFHLIDGVRQEQGPLHIVFREALVNLLVHADYSEPGASTVRCSPDRYVFQNPGNARMIDLDPEINIRGDWRNPTLVKMFQSIGLADDGWTGIPKIWEQWRALGYQPPAFDPGGTQRYQFTVTCRNSHLLSEEDREWLVALDAVLTDTEQVALTMTRNEGEIDNVRLRQAMDLHRTDATTVLSGLRDRGFLNKLGHGRSARYRLVARYGRSVVCNDTPATVPNTTGSRGNTPASMGDTTGTGGVRRPALGAKATASQRDTPATEERTSVGRRGRRVGPSRTLPRVVRDGEPVVGDSVARDGDLRDDPIWRTLKAIATPVASEPRVSRQLLADVIVELCAVRPLSILHLTWLVERKKGHLRDVLGQLIDARRISYLFPDKPQSPNQRYVIRGSPPVTPAGQTRLPSLDEADPDTTT